MGSSVHVLGHEYEFESLLLLCVSTYFDYVIVASYFHGANAF